MKIGDVMSIRFSPVNSWDWRCVAQHPHEVVVLQSPGGKREVHTLPVLRQWVREGKVEIRRMN